MAVGLTDLPDALRGDKGALRMMSDQMAAEFVAQSLAEYVDSVQLEQEREEQQAEAIAVLEQPKTIAPKKDWVSWAVAHGADEEEATAQTKNQLMAEYGERL
jgi:hypothetical protein